jgi:glycine dehydrogenase subunit 2
LPTPVVVKTTNGYELDHNRPQSIGSIREFWGNVPQIMKAYAWARAMGSDGLSEASDLSVLANNYMEKRLLAIRGITRSNPQVTQPRLEMTRYSMETLQRETGVSVLDVQNRMTDFGIDAFWLSHEPWLVPEPFTPEAGEMYSKEDLDYWIDVLARISDEAYSNPQIVKSAPHNQAIHKIDHAALEDPERWATTWRAYQRKKAQLGT